MYLLCKELTAGFFNMYYLFFVHTKVDRNANYSNYCKKGKIFPREFSCIESQKVNQKKSK
jgi:hypothetical protein